VTGSQPATRRTLASRVLVDVAPLRASPAYRIYFVAQLGGLLCRQLLVVAVPFDVYERTGSTLLVGLVGLVQAIPVVFMSIVGGVLADARDRRSILIAVNALTAVSALALAVATMATALWPTFVLIAVNAGLNGLESPVRSAIVPSLVGRELIPAAAALTQSVDQLLQIAGPAGGGVLIATTSVQTTYIVAAVGAGLTAVLVLPMRKFARSTTGGHARPSAIVDGWRYLRAVPVLQQIILIDLNAMVFGMPRALFPAIGTGMLGGNAATVGLLYGAPGVGAMIGALTTGWTVSVIRQGRAIVIATVVWGAAIAAFGLVRSVPLALVLLALAGLADVVSTVFRNTILQTRTPDRLLGRVTSFKTALSGAGPRLGDAEAGAVASAVSPQFSVVSGGVASVVGSLLVVWLGRDIWWQRRGDHDPEHDHDRAARPTQP
jgi:predicted MFS family arabinose efflux permease